MDLIYSAHDKTELGIIRKFALDYEISAEKNNNNFELELSINNYSIQNGCYFYAENTEIGGIVDSTKIDTSKRIIFFGGRTWRGILASKIIQPAVGQDYVIVSGEANEVIEGLLSDNDLSDMFKAETIPSELVLTNYRFDRYTDLHSGLIKMLSQNGYKLKIQHKDDGYVYLSAVPIVDFEQEREITSHLFDFVITKRNPTANHMIGLGKGQLKDRLVVHIEKIIVREKDKLYIRLFISVVVISCFYLSMWWLPRFGRFSLPLKYQVFYGTYSVKGCCEAILK